MVTLTSLASGRSDLNSTALGSKVTTLSSNIPELVRNAQMLAALAGQAAGSQLLLSGQGLAAALGQLLLTLGPTVEGKANRQDLLANAIAVGGAADALLAAAGITDVDAASRETLEALAKNIATATTSLVQSAKLVASKTADQAQQGVVIGAAKKTALATSQLVACTKVVASTLNSPLCQEQLVEAARQIAGAVEGMVRASQAACTDDELLQQVGKDAHGLTAALAELIKRIRDGSILAGGSGPSVWVSRRCWLLDICATYTHIHMHAH